MELSYTLASYLDGARPGAMAENISDRLTGTNTVRTLVRVRGKVAGGDLSLACLYVSNVIEKRLTQCFSGAISIQIPAAFLRT